MRAKKIKWKRIEAGLHSGHVANLRIFDIHKINNTWFISAGLHDEIGNNLFDGIEILNIKFSKLTLAKRHCQKNLMQEIFNLFFKGKDES